MNGSCHARHGTTATLPLLANMVIERHGGGDAEIVDHGSAGAIGEAPTGRLVA